VNVKGVLAVGLALVAAAVVLTLSGSPPRVLGTNAIAHTMAIGSTTGGASACQPGGALPRGTSAVRLGLQAGAGPSVTVSVQSGERVLTRGARGSGWTGGDVTVPVEAVRGATRDVRVCYTLGPIRGHVTIFGQQVGSPKAPTGRMAIEYLTAGNKSWWSSALSVARRIGLGRAPSGTWIAVLVALLMTIVATLASYLCLRELGAPGEEGQPDAHRRGASPARLTGMVGRVPTAAWICALVACLNAVCWSILSPPFQVPDETAHFAYVQQLAEAHELPSPGAEGKEFSLEEETAREDLRQEAVQFVPSQGTISSRAQQRRLESDLARPLSRRGSGSAAEATTEPPLYYALETIPYYLGASGTLLDRLELMRLLSALFGGLSALFVFMFVREALPGAPWAWTVGGLGAALAPLLGYMSGAVSPDALLFAVSAALFYLLARAFRRGLTPSLAAAFGTASAIGILTKLNFLGLLPGAYAGLAVVALRAPPRSRRSAYAAFGVAAALAAAPALLYIAFESVQHSASLSFLSSSLSNATRATNAPGEISYIWQFYLPRLPGMTNYFPGLFTPRQFWFDGLVGLYGWVDTVFPSWVDDLALLPAGLIALLCLRALVVSRSALRGRAVEFLAYTAMGVGLMALVGSASYVAEILDGQGPYWEPRYLLPMLPLLGAVLALAARGAGRRYGTAAGALIVVLFLAHDLFSQLLVISRFYG
jgi:Predicted membrane protein (DUF2142)